MSRILIIDFATAVMFQHLYFNKVLPGYLYILLFSYKMIISRYSIFVSEQNSIYFIFSFVMNKVFVAATKHNIKRNKTSPKQLRKKIKQFLNFFSTLCFISSIKNIKQNKRENIYSVCFKKKRH